MRRTKFWGLVSFFAYASIAIAYAGCGDDSVSPSKDAGVEAAIDAGVDAGGPNDAQPSDAGADVTMTVTDAGFDPCKSDLDAGVYTHLSCTGLYDDIGTKALNAGSKAYRPGAEAQNDGATSSRFIRIPSGTTIDTTDMDAWKFPVGTAAWQELSIAGKRVETRYLLKSGASTWQKATYVWNAAETDATRLDTGNIPDGGTYEIPKTFLCAGCHDGASDELLGFEAIGLGLPGATGLTLDALKTANLLTAPPATTTVTLPNDATTLAPPALAWMHANCGTSCHNDRANAGAMFTGMYLRVRATDIFTANPTMVTMLDSYLTTVNQPMSHVIPDAGTLNRITSGDPANSGLVLLASTRVNPTTTDQMPPILLHSVDTVGLQSVKNWIAAGP